MRPPPVGAFFFALSMEVTPPLTLEQRWFVQFALIAMVLTLFSGICGWMADTLFYEAWARHVSGRDAEASWRLRERANLARKVFSWLAIVLFLCGALATMRYVQPRVPA